MKTCRTSTGSFVLLRVMSRGRGARIRLKPRGLCTLRFYVLSGNNNTAQLVNTGVFAPLIAVDANTGNLSTASVRLGAEGCCQCVLHVMLVCDSCSLSGRVATRRLCRLFLLCRRSTLRGRPRCSTCHCTSWTQRLLEERLAVYRSISPFRSLVRSVADWHVDSCFPW